MHLYERRHSLDFGTLAKADLLSLKTNFDETLPGRIVIPANSLDPVTAETLSPLMVKLAELNEQHGELSLVWTERPCSNALHIRRIHGEDFAKLDVLTESDPYSEIKVLSDGEVMRHFTTSIVSNSDSPTWEIDESIVLAMGDTIRIDVYDFDRATTDDILGYIEFDPFKLEPGPGVPTTIDLELHGVPDGVDAGGLTLEVTLLGLQCVMEDGE